MNSVWNFVTTFSRLSLLPVLACLTGCGTFFFYPQKELLRTPADIGLTYEDVSVTSRDHVELHGWLLKAKHPRGIVFFLHGNAENISTHIASVFWLPAEGYDVLMMDYRGYGTSQGSPDFPEVFWDVDAFYRWLTAYARRRQLPVTILGQSLGAAISSYYFSELPAERIVFQGVVLDSVFSGQRAIARETLKRHIITWPLQYLVPLLLPGKYDPEDHVKDFSPIPVLFFHSKDDQVIPYSEGRQVFEHAGQPKYWVAGTGPHISTFEWPRNRRILLNFLSDPHRDPRPH